LSNNVKRSLHKAFKKQTDEQKLHE